MCIEKDVNNRKSGYKGEVSDSLIKAMYTTLSSKNLIKK